MWQCKDFGSQESFQWKHIADIREQRTELECTRAVQEQDTKWASHYKDFGVYVHLEPKPAALLEKYNSQKPTQGPKMHTRLLGNSRLSFAMYRWILWSIYNSVITSFKILRNHSWQKCQKFSASHKTVTRNTVCRSTSLKNSLKELPFALKFPNLHLYSNK